MKDWLSKWIAAYKKQTYPNGWQKERSFWSKKPPPPQKKKKKKPLLTTTDP